MLSLPSSLLLGTFLNLCSSHESDLEFLLVEFVSGKLFMKWTLFLNHYSSSCKAILGTVLLAINLIKLGSLNTLQTRTNDLSSSTQNTKNVGKLH